MNSITIDGVVGSGELWLNVMRIACGDTSGKSMLDAGCYKAPYTPFLGFSDRVYVDIQGRLLDHAEEQKNFIQDDALEYLYFCKRHFDVIVATDFLEHLTKEKGFEFMTMMKLQSDKQIIFTPLGDCMITDDDKPDSHHSGWTPKLFPDEWLCIVFPDFHPTLNTGAFFAIRCEEIERQRIFNEIKNKYVESRIY